MTFLAECATLLLLVKSCQTGNRFWRQRGPCEFKLLLSNVLTRCTIGTDLQEIFNWNRKALAPWALLYIVCRLPPKWLGCISTSHSFLYMPVGSGTNTDSEGAPVGEGYSAVSTGSRKERRRKSVMWELLLEKRRAGIELRVIYLWAQYRLLVLISVGHSRKEKSPLCI